MLTLDLERLTMKARNFNETKVVYDEGELTYAQRQLADFFASHQKRSALRRRKAAKTAEWAEKFDPLNGKTAGRRERLGAFGKAEAEA